MWSMTVRKGAEHVISQLADYFQSHIRNALQDVVQQMDSMENAVQKLVSNFGNSAVGVICQAEAVELANIRSPHLARANGESTAKNDTRNLRLQLRNKLSLSLFTGEKLEGDGGARISVALIDADTGDVVTSGPEASIKLDVIVLEGDFKKDDEKNWAPEEFDSYVVKEREGKRPLLIGNLQVKLKAGVGDLGDMIFTDNSSWTRSKRFRIGLKVASSDGRNTRIREAKTDAFSVKEHRGQAYKKNHPPASDNEVWRLESIAKDGSFHKRLNEAGIHKVEQFLRQHSVDSEKLRNILGKGMTEKKWKVLLDHAKTCTLNGKLHVYHDGNENDHGATFNSVGQLSDHTVGGLNNAADRFSPQQKVLDMKGLISYYWRTKGLNLVAMDQAPLASRQTYGFDI
ncbi:calmodulin-binding protein 60 D-like [Eucalyptus grandis]|uniref:calmodulin-binding protein 60 D-like n=1 Tax=Eucalyptus grandis TaxID=71139 RepID=UPI00192EAAEE|nr:calmodulin-binding protein 60 D-like [Eucalyptus grandis]